MSLLSFHQLKISRKTNEIPEYFQYFQELQTLCNGNWTARGYANSRIANSQTGHLADWSTSDLDNSQTSQLTDWTSCGLDNSWMSHLLKHFNMTQ